MPLQPFPLSNIGYPAHGWLIPQGGNTGVPDASGNYAHRNNIYYEGQTARINQFASSTYTWTAVQMIPSFNNGKDIGDVIATGIIANTTPSVNSLNTLTLSAFPAGSYCILFDLQGDVDSNYGTSAGRSFITVLRRHPGFPQTDVDFATSKWNQGQHQFMSPNGFGRSDADINAGKQVAAVDMVARSVLSMGAGRINIVGTNSGGAFVPESGAQPLSSAVDFFTNVAGPYWLNPTNPEWADTARTRLGWTAITNIGNSYDSVTVHNDGTQASFIAWANFYPKTPAIDGSKVFVKVTAGTSSGAKVQIYYPDAVTLAETYDNQTTNSIQAATTGSTYIKAFGGGATGFTAISSPTAIGIANRNTIISIVQQLVAVGCTRFEGPYNEPTMSAETGHLFWLFQDAVKTGGGKAIGPSPVNINNNPSGGRLSGLSVLLDYLISVGLTKNDFGLAFHDYNSMENSDVNELRFQIETFLTMLKGKGLDGIEMWQTEANYGVPDQTPVFKPTFARRSVLHQLVWEQYGLPRERNATWYDGPMFFSKPWALIDNNQALHPYGYLQSVLGQETKNMAHHHRIDFGSVPANRMYSGSLYGDPLTGSVAVMWCHSAMPNSLITLKIAGSTDPLEVVDASGIVGEFPLDPLTRTVSVPVPEFPMYVRLPAGVTMTIDHVRNIDARPSVSRARATTVLGGATKTELTDDAFKLYDGNVTTGLAVSGASLPDTAEVTFTQSIGPVSHVIVFCGPANDAQPGLLQYQVQTYDGSTWNTQSIRVPNGTFGTTVLKTPPASFLHGDGASSLGTTRDQYWREEWIDDIEFQTPVANFRGFRLVVPVGGLSYGGAVDASADAIMSGYGRSSGTDPRLHLQEIMILSAASPTATGLAAPANTSPAAIQTGTSFVTGQQLQAFPGLWTNNPTSFLYQWQRSPSPTTGFVNIDAANTSTYLATDADGGYYLRVVETGKNLAGFATANSTAVGPFPTVTPPTPPGSVICQVFAR